MPFPPREYFGASNEGGESLHSLDAKVFGDKLVSEASLARILEDSTSERFNGLAEFIVCGFELSLLNQAIYTHFRSAHLRWLDFTAHSSLWPWTKHPLVIGDHRPNSILRFAQEPSGFTDAVPVRVTPDLLRDYTEYFFGEYLARFMTAHQEVSILRGQFVKAIAEDKDCVASLRTNGRWKPKAIEALLGEHGREPRQERRWMPATPEEKGEIKSAIRFADTGRILKRFDFRARNDPRHRGTSYEAKKELALCLSRHERRLDLSSSEWEEIIGLAARRNDHDFFKRLGRSLTTDRPNSDPTDVQSFLLKHWVVRADGLPELFYLTFPDLLKVLKDRDVLRADARNTAQWMEKTCVRFGLKPIPRRMKAEARLTAEVDQQGGLRFRRPDGWLYP